jgi:hypothetical protein
MTEGPFICTVRSDDPSRALLVWETDEPCTSVVYARKGRGESGHREKATEKASSDWLLPATDAEAGQRPPGPRAYPHEVELTGLEPDTVYEYSIQCRSARGHKVTTPTYTFRTAPQSGSGKVTFVFASDSREGVGGGEQNYMGHNLRAMQQIALAAHRHGAAFIIFGGDLVNGYTTETEDFRLQMRGWKQALAGYWRGGPVYPAMGNHETLLNVFNGIAMDKWPYDTDSAEAVFAEQFWNPLNGPQPSDPRRPSYAENVYHFQYGPVLCVAFNNNYWWTTNDKCDEYGGSPEGYIMSDQMAWIERVLERAEKDASVKYVLLYAQEPIFPCGGHVSDSMWWDGDNNLRACSYRDGRIVPETEGMIECRNRFWKAVAGSSKVAAVLAGDEHEYHRLLVDDTTPVGVMKRDDANGNNKLDDGRFSPNPAFRHPTWHITAGTAGAPDYAREKTPGEPVLLSSQMGYCLFEADGAGISMTFYSLLGQKVDHVPDLMRVKHTR